MKHKCSKVVVIVVSANEAVRVMLEENKGVITSAQITKAGIQRRVLSLLIASGEIYRVERGIYAAHGVWEDEMYFLQYRFSKGVFSNETALYLHGMSDRTPQRYTMTFPHGYNTAGVKKSGVTVKATMPEVYDLGIMEKPSPCGNYIRVYDKERTLCDIVKGNNSCDIQLVNQAMKSYASSTEKEIAKLLSYAERLQVKPKVLRYMEVLL
jgi:predicted transcriptional regulator of viral defense system